MEMAGRVIHSWSISACSCIIICFLSLRHLVFHYGDAVVDFNRACVSCRCVAIAVSNIHWNTFSTRILSYLIMIINIIFFLIIITYYIILWSRYCRLGALWNSIFHWDFHGIAFHSCVLTFELNWIRLNVYLNEFGEAHNFGK